MPEEEIPPGLCLVCGSCSAEVKSWEGCAGTPGPCQLAEFRDGWRRAPGERPGTGWEKANAIAKWCGCPKADLCNAREQRPLGNLIDLAKRDADLPTEVRKEEVHPLHGHLLQERCLSEQQSPHRDPKETREKPLGVLGCNGGSGPKIRQHKGYNAASHSEGGEDELDDPGVRGGEPPYHESSDSCQTTCAAAPGTTPADPNPAVRCPPSADRAG